MSSSRVQESPIAAMRRTIQERLPRFRVLIIGANDAQKEEMTRRVSGTKRKPLVWDGDGKRIDWIDMNTGWPHLHTYWNSSQRLSINHETRYPDNPGFIFHESKGFTGDDKEELQKVYRFIDERLTRPELHERLHAIWYCIPSRIEGPPSDAEQEFLQKGNGGIPIILIANKQYLGNILATINQGELGATDCGYLRRLLGEIGSKQITVRHDLTLALATARAIDNPILLYWFIALQWEWMDLKYKNCIERIIPYVLNGSSERLHRMVEEISNTFLNTYMYNVRSRGEKPKTTTH